MSKRSPLVKSLFERYKQALADEGTLEEEHERIYQNLADTREIKKLCAALLRKEGFDVNAASPETGDPMLVRMPARQSDTNPASAQNGHTATPLNATHAVYLIMRKRGNVGFTVEDLERLSNEEGMPLTTREIHKVVWTQSKKGRMQKMDDGHIRLTPEGEKFDKFRRKPSEEETIEAIRAAAGQPAVAQ